MLDLDGIGRAFNYTLDALWSLTPAQIDWLSFVGFVERYGIAALDDLIPKNERHGKLDPPAPYDRQSRTTMEEARPKRPAAHAGKSPRAGFMGVFSAGK